MSVTPPMQVVSGLGSPQAGHARFRYPPEVLERGVVSLVIPYLPILSLRPQAQPLPLGYPLSLASHEVDARNPV